MHAITFITYYLSPIGHLCITGNEEVILSVTFSEHAGKTTGIVPALGLKCVQQLQGYFKGERQDFDLPLAPMGTTFQQQVWQSLRHIPFGKTSSYLQVARAVSGEKAIRAVGGANGRNPICVIVPCHRVIGSDGSLTGYAGGLWRKEWLLQHEGALKPTQQLSFF